MTAEAPLPASPGRGSFAERFLPLLGSVRGISSAGTSEELVTRVIQAVREAVPADRVSLLVADRARGLLRIERSESEMTSHPSPDLRLDQEAGVTVRAVRERRTVHVPDTSRDPLYIATDSEIRSEIALPLLAGDEVYGVLDVQSTTLGPWGAEDQLLLEALAESAGAAMRHILIREELQQRRDWLQTLIVSSPDAIITTDVHGRITYWSPGAEGLLGYPAQEAFGRPASDFYAGGAGEARRVMEALRGQGKLVSHGCAVRARDGRLVNVSLSASLLPVPGQAEPATLGILTDITPLKDLEGRLERTIGMLREANERLERLATTDALSGLANHRVFYLRLEEERERSNRGGRPFAVLLVDIDDFKTYNDTWGHLVGDQVIEEMGRVLVGCIRKVDIGCRYGGEEFTVILPETRGEAACLVGERIRSALGASPLFRRLGIPAATVSVGVAAYDPAHARPPAAEVVRAADQAMYSAKKEGGDRIRLHEGSRGPGS